MSIKELPNGIRVVFLPIKSTVAHCAFIANVGTRDEQKVEMGMAHFLEHTIFKGTQKRKAYHILSRIDDVGGELNAYTTKEDITVYASFLKEHLERSLELLTDILFNSIFPEKELEKEKDVVLEEINSYKDSPQDAIFDEVEEMIFKDHPIGYQILGTPKTVKSFNRQKVIDFIQRNLYTDEIVLCITGDFTTAKINKLLDKYIVPISAKINRKPRLLVNGYTPQDIVKKKKTFQNHLIIANRAVNADNKQTNAMVLLNNLLGGPPMNNRLNLNIRERYGFTYNLESFYSPYSDSGIFGVYAGMDKGTAEKTKDLILKEFKKLREQPLGTLQLSKSINQLVGQVAMGQESNHSNMLGIGKHALNHNRIFSVKDAIERISKITSAEIQDLAQEVLDENQLSFLMYQSK